MVCIVVPHPSDKNKDVARVWHPNRVATFGSLQKQATVYCINDRNHFANCSSGKTPDASASIVLTTAASEAFIV